MLGLFIVYDAVMTTPLTKPKFGDSCTGCGYCCTAQPCALAVEFLKCSEGPCVALEAQGGRFVCGLVRNPLGYLYQATHPEEAVPFLDSPPSNDVASQLSADIAAALGVGLGCDSTDDEESAAWRGIVPA